MSIIKKIFGAITAFLGSIFGIFSKKKNGEFFLEIDSSKDSAAATAPAAKAAPAAATAAPAAATAPAPAPAAKPAKTAKAKTAKAAPKAAPAAAAVNQALNMPAPTVTATIEPLDIPKFGPRRRPGSNMQSFLDMAKTVKS